MRNRVEIMHGVNLDQLGRRDPAVYGSLDLVQIERRVSDWGGELGLTTRFFQTNHEGDFVEHLHRLEGMTDAILINPGAWTHYAWSIRDALEITGLPAIEIHLSDVQSREEFRRHSVIRDLCLTTITGKGVDGYHEALRILAGELAG